jgi:FMN phosphatase YigB (HAD superfamily)
MIRWVFLDVGNILLDEDPLAYRNFQIHWEAVRHVRPDVKFLDLLAERERRALAGSRWPLYESIVPILGDARCAAVWQTAEREIRTRYAELSPPIPWGLAALEDLTGICRLGLIANQGAECRACLRDLGVLDKFDVVALSEEVGAAKPDSRLFEAALRLANAAPNESLMVGDRLDNDVIPAAALGLRTAWIRWPKRAAKGWHPRDADAVAFRDSLERVSERSTSLWPDARPTFVADDPRGLLSIIDESRDVTE